MPRPFRATPRGPARPTPAAHPPGRHARANRLCGPTPPCDGRCRHRRGWCCCTARRADGGGRRSRRTMRAPPEARAAQGAAPGLPESKQTNKQASKQANKQGRGHARTLRAVPGCAVGSLTLRGRWQLFDAHVSALVSAAFAALAALIEERVRHLRQPLGQRSCAHSFRLSGPHPAPQSAPAHARAVRMRATVRGHRRRTGPRRLAAHDFGAAPGRRGRARVRACAAAPAGTAAAIPT